MAGTKVYLFLLKSAVGVSYPRSLEIFLSLLIRNSYLMGLLRIFLLAKNAIRLEHKATAHVSCLNQDVICYIIFINRKESSVNDLCKCIE